MARDPLILAALAVRRHRACFGAPPVGLAVAPGRVNLIGEHVDHAGGPVLPVAIDRRAAVTISPGVPGRVRVDSRELGRAVVSADVADAAPWARAMAMTAQSAGLDLAAAGCDLGIVSDLPVGGGLSSSAAVLVAAQLAIRQHLGTELDGPGIASAARTIEHDILGVPCGPMDQLASALGRRGHALLLHCDRGDHRHVRLPDAGLHLLLIDTGVRRTLADGRYAARLAELQCAREALGVEHWPTFAASVAAEDALTELDRRDPPAAGRARHVVSEMERTLAAAQALEHRDPARFGQLLDASHTSMRDDFDASIPGVEAVRGIIDHAAGSARLGSRLVGAGWGGGVLVATRRPLSPATLASILHRATAATGHRARAMPVRPSDGARIVDPGTT